MRRVLLVLLVIILGVPAIYLGIAFGLALVTPRLALPSGQGIAIYACDNGVHTDLVLPIAGGNIDWRDLLPGPFPRSFSQDTYLSFGWGSRDFYINTPTWADVRVGTAIKALLWDETVVHVEYRAKPGPAETCGTWMVGTRDYLGIVDHVLSSVRGAHRIPGPAPVAPGYGPNDVFYAANGQYTAIDTCNQWTGQALRAGGAPVAPWTPFSFLVLWNLPMISK